MALTPLTLALTLTLTLTLTSNLTLTLTLTKARRGHSRHRRCSAQYCAAQYRIRWARARVVLGCRVVISAPRHVRGRHSP